MSDFVPPNRNQLTSSQDNTQVTNKFLHPQRTRLKSLIGSTEPVGGTRALCSFRYSEGLEHNLSHTSPSHRSFGPHFLLGSRKVPRLEGSSRKELLAIYPSRCRYPHSTCKGLQTLAEPDPRRSGIVVSRLGIQGHQFPHPQHVAPRSLSSRTLIRPFCPRSFP